MYNVTIEGIKAHQCKGEFKQDGSVSKCFLKLYDFKELPEEVKSKVIDKYRDDVGVVLSDIITEDILSNAKDEFKKNKIKLKEDSKIDACWELYGQSAGVALTGDVEYKKHHIKMEVDRDCIQRVNDETYAYEEDSKDFSEEAKSIIKDIDDDLFKLAREDYKNMTSDESIAEDIETRDILFWKDGTEF